MYLQINDSFDMQQHLSAITGGQINDANGVFFARELDYVLEKTYDVKFAALNAMDVFPIETEGGEWAETITYTSFDKHGEAGRITDYAGDLNRVDTSGVQQAVIIEDIGASFGYSFKELAQSQQVGKSLSARRGEVAKRSIYEQINNIAFGINDAPTKFAGINGLLNYPGLAQVAATTGTWSGATGEQIYKDITIAYDAMVSDSNNVERPDTLLLPPAQYELLTEQYRGDRSDINLLDNLKKSKPSLTSILPVRELAGTGTGSTNVFALYNRNANNIHLRMPMPFQQFAPQLRNMEFVVPAMARTAGLVIPYVKSVKLINGI